jgi:hypothetical protein
MNQLKPQGQLVYEKYCELGSPQDAKPLTWDELGKLPGDLQQEWHRIAEATKAVQPEQIAQMEAIINACYEDDGYMKLLDQHDKESRALRKKNDGYGWNFYQGMRHGVIERQMDINHQVRLFKGLVKELDEIR